MAALAGTAWRGTAAWGEGVKTLVFGETGQVATELRAQGDVIALGRDQADLSRPEDCAAAIRDHAPQVVINAAAYTAVDRAEEEEALATVINGDAPGAMACACADLGIPLVHISTDYVFAGTGTAPWTPDDLAAPPNAYGRSKLAGERAIAASGCTHVILRTSWVYSAHGNNFVKTMLRLSETRDALSIVADQIGGPTSARAIAAACLVIADRLVQDPKGAGIHHLSGTPDASWADFATEIFAQAGRSVTVTGISTSEYPTPAVRPLNSRMDCDSLQQAFGIDRPEWRKELTLVLRALDEV